MYSKKINARKNWKFTQFLKIIFFSSFLIVLMSNDILKAFQTTVNISLTFTTLFRNICNKSEVKKQIPQIHKA